MHNLLALFTIAFVSEVTTYTPLVTTEEKNHVPTLFSSSLATKTRAHHIPSPSLRRYDFQHLFTVYLAGVIACLKENGSASPFSAGFMGRAASKPIQEMHHPSNPHVCE